MMQHVPRTRLTLPAVAGRLERGVRPHRGAHKRWLVVLRSDGFYFDEPSWVYKLGHENGS